jgi:hypothetical protein
MDYDWDDEAEESYAGPDAYIDGPEIDVEDQVMQDDPDLTAELGGAAVEDDDGLTEQRQSMLEMLDCQYSSYVEAVLAPT